MTFDLISHSIPFVLMPAFTVHLKVASSSENRDQPRLAKSFISEIDAHGSKEAMLTRD
jgi:hypothetical protein